MGLSLASCATTKIPSAEYIDSQRGEDERTVYIFLDVSGIRYIADAFIATNPEDVEKMSISYAYNNSFTPFHRPVLSSELIPQTEIQQRLINDLSPVPIQSDTHKTGFASFNLPKDIGKIGIVIDARPLDPKSNAYGYFWHYFEVNFNDLVEDTSGIFIDLAFSVSGSEISGGGGIRTTYDLGEIRAATIFHKRYANYKTYGVWIPALKKENKRIQTGFIQAK
jgi:hypothetical protein